jgi:hypothetical protein
MKIKEITLFAMLTAILFLGQTVLAPIPNVEVVSLLIIVYAVVFKWKSLIIIYVFVILQGVTYGFGIWWLSYLYIWAILAALSIALAPIFRDRSLLWALFAGLYGLIFGTLTSIPYLFMGRIGFAAAYIISGIPYDLIHAGGNFAVTLLLFYIVKKTLLRVIPK